MNPQGAPLHQKLFRLAARAAGVAPTDMMRRLCTGIANHFGAVACSLHADLSGWPKAEADPVRDLSAMSALDRARRETMEARLVRETLTQGKMISALDLENRDEVEAFFHRTLGVVDVFAFPLRYREKIRAVLVLYLSLDSDPLSEADVYGLLACGEILSISEDAAQAALTPRRSG